MTVNIKFAFGRFLFALPFLTFTLRWWFHLACFFFGILVHSNLFDGVEWIIYFWLKESSYEKRQGENDYCNELKSHENAGKTYKNVCITHENLWNLYKPMKLLKTNAKYFDSPTAQLFLQKKDWKCVKRQKKKKILIFL